MRLTYKMLDAMNTALAELLAGEGPQGAESPEAGQAEMIQADKAQAWTHQEMARRRVKSRRRRRDKDLET